MPAMSGIDREIEDHRRDPDPHPRWRRQIDGALAQLGEQIAALTPTDETPEIPVPGNSTPKPVEHGVDPAVGTKTGFAREDHQHQLILPPVLEHMAAIAGPGVVQADADSALTAVQKEANRVGVWDAEGLTARDGFTATEDLVTVPALRATDQAGTGERLVLADAEGDQRAEANAVWETGYNAFPAPTWGYDCDGDQLNLAGANALGMANMVYANWSGSPPKGMFHGSALGLSAGGSTVATVPGGPLTLTMLLNFDDAGGVLGKTGYVDVERMRVEITNGVGIEIVTGGGALLLSLPNTSASVYMHLALVSDGTTVTVYVNGSVAGTFADPAPGADITYLSTYSSSSTFGTIGFADIFCWPQAIDADGINRIRTERSTRPWIAPDENDVLVLKPSVDLRIDDHAGAGQRMQTAMPDGTLTPVADVVWDPGLPDEIAPGGDTWGSIALASGSTRVLAFNPWATGSEVKYVAISSAGSKFLYSLDRVTWSAGTAPSPNTSGSIPIGVACGIGPSSVVCWYTTAVGSGGYTTLARSYDGIAWTTVLTSPQLGHIAYGNGRWVIHNYNAATVRVSTDGGVNWTNYTAALSSSESASLQYLGDRFVLGFTASLRAYVSFSTDGVTWTTSAAVLGVDSTCKGAARSNVGTLIAGVSGGTSGLYRSIDNGATWSLVQSLSSVVSVTYFLGTFIAAQVSGAIYRSSDDGATWAAVSSSLGLSDVTFDDTRFIAAGSSTFASSADVFIPGTDDTLELLAGTRFRVLDHVGSTQRMLTADADGYHTPVASVVWTGTWLQIAGKDVAAVSANGIVTRTAAGTFASRTLTGPAAGITVTNGDGVAGNPTLALANDLAALEGLTATGLVARTADGAAAARTITAGEGIAVANGDGVRGNPVVRGVAPTPSSFGGFPSAPLAIPANQHRVNVLAASFGV